MELNQATIDREVKTMEAKLNTYNMASLGEIPTQRDDGAFKDPSLSNGQLLGERSQGIEDSINRKTDNQIQNKSILVHGAELQLGNGRLIGQPCIMVPPRRKRDKISRSQ